MHNDILGGMNNWLEHRCPLAVYGCGFSHRRMYPGRKEANQTLIFSPAVESFGIEALTTDSQSNRCDIKGLSKAKLPTPTATLTNLPLEVLIDIIKYLDSFR